MSEDTGSIRPQGEIVLYQPAQGDEPVRVLLEGETVWLTQNLLAELYQTSKQNISYHIKSIYEEGELDPEATVKKYLTVRQEADARYAEDLRTSANVIEQQLKKTPKKEQTKGKKKGRTCGPGKGGKS